MHGEATYRQQRPPRPARLRWQWRQPQCARPAPPSPPQWPTPISGGHGERQSAGARAKNDCDGETKVRKARITPHGKAGTCTCTKGYTQAPTAHSYDKRHVIPTHNDSTVPSAAPTSSPKRHTGWPSSRRRCFTCSGSVGTTMRRARRSASICHTQQQQPVPARDKKGGVDEARGRLGEHTALTLTSRCLHFVCVCKWWMRRGRD